MVKKIGMFLLVMSVSSFAVKIGPTLFDERIDAGVGYKEIVIENTAKKPVRYKIDIKDTNSDSTKSIAKWMKASPKIINIPAGSKKVVKLFGELPDTENLPDDEYSFLFSLDPITIPTIANAKGEVGGSAAVGIGAVVQMLGYVGDPKFSEKINLEEMELKEVKDDNGRSKNLFTAKLINDSYAGKNIAFKFIGKNNTMIDGKWIGRIGANMTKDLSFEVKSEFKEIVVYDGETREDIKTIKFS